MSIVPIESGMFAHLVHCEGASHWLTMLCDFSIITILLGPLFFFCFLFLFCFSPTFRYIHKHSKIKDTLDLIHTYFKVKYINRLRTVIVRCAFCLLPSAVGLFFILQISTWCHCCTMMTECGQGALPCHSAGRHQSSDLPLAILTMFLKLMMVVTCLMFDYLPPMRNNIDVDV